MTIEPISILAAAAFAGALSLLPISASATQVTYIAGQGWCGPGSTIYTIEQTVETTPAPLGYEKLLMLHADNPCAASLLVYFGSRDGLRWAAFVFPPYSDVTLDNNDLSQLGLPAVLRGPFQAAGAGYPASQINMPPGTTYLCNPCGS